MILLLQNTAVTGFPEDGTAESRVILIYGSDGTSRRIPELPMYSPWGYVRTVTTARYRWK